MLPPIIVELKALSGEFTTKMGEAKGELAALDAEGKTHLSSLAKYGKIAAVGVAALAVGIGAMSVKLGVEFQESQASLQAHAGLTAAAAAKIGNAFLATGFHTTFSAQQMITALAPVSGEMENLTGHTLTTAESMRLMSAASDLAEASGSSLADSTKTLADVMLPFHIRTQDAAAASNVLWNAQRLLGVSTTDLGTTFARMAPLVAGSGMSLTQMSGLMVELSHSLGSGRMATRQAGRAIQMLVVPTTAANKALAAMGVNLFDAQGKFIGMGPALSKLHAGLARLPGATGAFAAEQKILAATTEMATLHGEAQTKAVKAQEKALTQQLAPLKAQAAAYTQSSAMQAIFGRSANAMLAVVAGGAGGLAKYTSAVAQNGQVQSAAAIMAGTLKGQMKLLAAGVDDLGTKLGMVLVPFATKAIKVLMDVATWLGKNKPVAIGLAAVIGGVLLAAMIAWAAATIAATWPLLAIGAAIAVVGVAVYAFVRLWREKWPEIKRVVMDVWRPIQRVFHDIVQVGLYPIRMDIQILRDVWHVVWGQIQSSVATAWRFIKPIFDAITRGIGDVTKGISSVTHLASSVSHGIGGVLGSAGKLLGFDAGGVVPGAVGSPMLAMVHGGEVIIPPGMISSPGRPPGGGLRSGGRAGAAGSGAAGTTVHVHFTGPFIGGSPADAKAFAEHIGAAMQQTLYDRQNFGVPVLT
ncbi:MAG: phage tail tape measure protein [Dermatophilaceae bacterium]